MRPAVRTGVDGIAALMGGCFAADRLKRPGRTSGFVEAGTAGGAVGTEMGGLARLGLMKAKCHLTSWHSEHFKV